ncbi:hypothetical protein SDD34_02315 [Streptococcus agalactiae]|nr:hypothetical protein SDD34_02315 [Streptococcus agalactiae]
MGENLNSNIDPRIIFKQLPPATIIKGFVAGDTKCNYEIYLLELLNKSVYFREKGKSKFHAPEDESHGECDAVADDYKIDFKFLSSSSRLQASSLFSPSITNLGNGITAIGESRNPNGEIKATQIHVAFRFRTVSDLIRLKVKRQHVRKQCLEKDIIKVLNMLEKQKNLLLFFPYIFYTEEEISTNELDNIILNAISYDFSSLFAYRHIKVQSFETYLLTIVRDEFNIFKISNKRLKLIEKLSCSELPTFVKLKSYSI